MAIDILQSEGIAPPGQGVHSPQGQDILQSEGIAPPSTATKAAGDFVDRLLQSHPLINAGVQAGQTVGQAIDNVINLASAGHLHLKAPEVAVPGRSAEVGKLLGGGAALELGGEAAGAAKLGEAVAGARKVLPGMIERAVGGAVVAPGLVPKQPGKAALETLAVSPVADVAALGAGKAVGAIKGAIKNKSALAQSVLRNFFSKDAAPFIKNKFEGIINDLKGSSSKATSSNDLYNNLNTHYEELAQDNSLRGPEDVPNTYVDPGTSVGDAYARVPVGLPADQSVINKKITSQVKELKDKMAPFAGTAQAKAPYQDAINQLEDIKKSNIQTVGDAKQLKEIINNSLRDKTLNPVVKPYLTDLRDNAIKGEKGAISVGVGKADPQAAALLNEADTRYKNEMVPFQETARGKKSPFWNMKTGAASPDKIGSSYLKPGAQKDQQALLDNFLKMAPPDNGATRKLLAYDYFKDVDDNPAEIVKRWSKLGEGQKSALLPEYKEELDQLAKLQKEYPDAFKEPKAGSFAEKIKSGAKIGSSVLLGTHGHLALSPLPFLIPSMLSGAARKAFENPEMQKYFIEDLANKNLLSKADIPLAFHYLRGVIAAAPATKLKSEEK